MKKYPHRPTLADVATAAGLSTVTVSRVVEGSAKVAPATAQRVRQVMEEIGYFGNNAASGLVSGRPSTIGVVTSNTTDYGYAATTRGIEEEARAAGIGVLICVVEGAEEESVRSAVRAVASHAVSGVIAMDFDQATRSVVQALPAYLPVVTTTATEDGGPEREFVAIDERTAGRKLAEHLLDLGHQSIFVLAPPGVRGTIRRTQAIMEVLEERRLPHYPLVHCPDWQADSGYSGTIELLESYGSQVTALACGNDEIAMGALRALHDSQLRVPDDVSVIGFDDHPLARYSLPALTTAAQDFGSLGRLAFRRLNAIFQEQTFDSAALLPAELKIRESTAPPSPERGLRRVG